MRQLKQMMRARKAQMLWCGPCECLTLKCRKENDEFCNCNWESWGWPLSITRDRDYDWTTLVVWQTMTIGLTLSRNANVNFRTESWYYQIQAIVPWADNHYDIQLLASSISWEQWLVPDTFIVEDEKWTRIGTVSLYLYVEVENFSVDTTPIATYLHGMARIPFTYSPSNARPEWWMVQVDLWYISEASYWDWEWYFEFYATQEGTWVVVVEAYWSTYTIDITVGPCVNEIIGLNTDTITFDLDNSPSPVTRSFTYSPAEGAFESISVSSDVETIAGISVEKTSDWNWYIQVTPWNEANSTWVHISSPMSGQMDIPVQTTSQYPNAYLTGWEYLPDRVNVWETVRGIFNYGPWNARFDSLYVTVNYPDVLSATLTDLGNNRAEISITGTNEWVTGVAIWNYGAGWNYISINVLPSIEDEIINWFTQTPVFQNLMPDQQEQAIADARAIIVWAWWDIIPFYNAVLDGRTFSQYVNEQELTVDTSGDCGSSVYEDTEAFTIYIGTALGVECQYLALVARRWISPNRELINKEAISSYLDWVTTESDDVTYQFKDWDWEILKFGSVASWEIPEAPDNPSRDGYTFTWWDPSVGEISEDTTFTAQYVQNIPVESISIPLSPEETDTKEVHVEVWATESVDFDYLPTNANDFSNVVFDCEASYGEEGARMWISSHWGWSWTITVQWIEEWDVLFYVKIGEQIYWTIEVFVEEAPSY